MPYNPGVSYHGDQYLYQGGADLGKGIGEAIEKYKKENDTAKGIDTIMKANPELHQEAGVDPEKWKGLSSREKGATFAALAQSMAMKQQKQQVNAKLADELSQRNYRDTQTAGMQQDQDAMAQFQALNNGPSHVMQPGKGPARAPEGMARMAEMLNNGITAGLSPSEMQHLGQTAHALDAAKGRDPAQLKIVKHPETGQWVAVLGNSMQILGPELTDVIRTKPVVSSNGLNLGEAMPGRKGGFSMIPKQKPKAGMVEPQKDTDGNDVPGIWIDTTSGERVHVPINSLQALTDAINPKKEKEAKPGAAAPTQAPAAEFQFDPSMMKPNRKR